MLVNEVKNEELNPTLFLQMVYEVFSNEKDSFKFRGKCTFVFWFFLFWLHFTNVTSRRILVSLPIFCYQKKKHFNLFVKNKIKCSNVPKLLTEAFGMTTLKNKIYLSGTQVVVKMLMNVGISVGAWFVILEILGMKCVAAKFAS